MSDNTMSNANLMVESALKKLKDSRPQERTPHACIECSKSHRKCGFKNQQSRCDTCERKNLQCTFPPRQQGFSRAGSADNSPYPTLPQLQTRQGNAPFGQHTTMSGTSSNSSSSSADSPVLTQSSSGYVSSGSIPPQQGNTYAAYPTATAAGVSGGYPVPPAPYEPAQIAYGFGDAHRQATGSSLQHNTHQASTYAPAPQRGASVHYESAQAHSQVLQPNYVSDSAQWASHLHPQQQQQQCMPPAAGQTYQSPAIYLGTRQTSAPNIHAANVGQSHVRPAQTYQTQSSTSLGGVYTPVHANMHQAPPGAQQQNFSIRYPVASGEAYDQSHTPPVPGSAHAGSMYGQQNKHQ